MEQIQRKVISTVVILPGDGSGVTVGTIVIASHKVVKISQLYIVSEVTLLRHISMRKKYFLYSVTLILKVFHYMWH